MPDPEIARKQARGDCIAMACDRCSDIIPCHLNAAQRTLLADVLAQVWDGGCHYGSTAPAKPEQPGMDQIRAYMKASGWEPRPPGPAGEMWHREGWPHGIAVAFEGDPGSLECRSVITRLSWAEGRGELEVAADIARGPFTPETGSNEMTAETSEGSGSE